MRGLISFFATGCFTGLLPVAPGTWGSLIGVLFYWAIKGLPPLAFASTLIAFIVFAIWISNYAQGIFKECDPPQVTIDEIAGYLVTMAFHRPLISVALAGFFLFRIFDILKPPPIRWFERRFSDGRSIVLDDVMAGVYANAALWGFELALPVIGIKW